jgi:glycosyltransferase involved in cell wall biosynthesis
MSLTVLSVAFWLTALGPGSVGGAEQILSQIDAVLVRRGYRSLVIAHPESRVSGTLIPTLSIKGPVSDQTWYAAHGAIRRAISYALAHYPVDIVHMHDIHFADCLPPGDVATLVTLHGPANWYKKQAFQLQRRNTFFHCVSRSQRETFPPGIQLLADIENGVASELLVPRPEIRRRDFVAMLGRICPEKGFHLGFGAARRAGSGALLAGRVFPFPEHERYFSEQILPELDSARRYVGAVGSRARRRLLASARCVIVPSLVPETSSLVAREAIASGTPVVAFSRGALPEIVEQGKTGFLIDDESALPDAIRACRWLDPEHCRQAAKRLLTPDRMVDNYIAAYRQILELSCRNFETAS